MPGLETFCVEQYSSRMSIQTVVTPSGHLMTLTCANDKSSLPQLTEKAAGALHDAFSDSSAAALVLLASGKPQTELPADFLFWRDFAQVFFHQLCSLGAEDLTRAVASKTRSSHTVKPPEELPLIERIRNAPPMRGLEYLTPEVLRNLWNELQQYALDRAASSPDGPVVWLKTVSPHWNLLGRVTFHLAENKRDPDRPFAFLATYTHRMSSIAKLQHLPLAEALKQYAGEKNQEKLTALLEPVRNAAKNSVVVREMLDSRQLFQPHSLSVGQAHRLLTDVPQMESAGLVMRLPDWRKVRKNNRPEVQVRIGDKKKTTRSVLTGCSISPSRWRWTAKSSQPKNRLHFYRPLMGCHCCVANGSKWISRNYNRRLHTGSR
jgi:hypothetical protein